MAIALATTEQAPEPGTSQWFRQLRSSLNGPTLADAEAWGALAPVEKKMILAVAGYSKLGRWGGRGQSDLGAFARMSWYELPDPARQRVKNAVGRMQLMLGRFGGMK